MATQSRYQEFELTGYDISAVVDTQTGEVYVPGARIERRLQLAADSVRKIFAAKSFKALPGMGLQFGKKSGLVENEAGRQDKQTLYHIDIVSKLLGYLASTGNQEALNMLCAGFADSVESIALEKAGMALTAEDRENNNKWRTTNKTDFHPVLTASIQRNIDPAKGEWSKYINQFQSAIGIKSGTRDQLETEQQIKLAIAQHKAAALLDAGLEWTAVLRALG